MGSTPEAKRAESQENKSQPTSLQYMCMKQYMCEKAEDDSNKVVCLTVHRFFRKIRGGLEEVQPLNGLVGLEVE
ncbi:Schizosaccharomyces specific protein [Schizosaccharomyces osmophilus]|uniref:Schizosaccharomyces specific protein n=1 Tax=Schizosaccharomyces osmophilus TaxID=2545709 RepID=A0AAE9WC32_9SCHI|nr:Schizosaccharomyces specific protein [Schizosaccharomyces osmophilus]WBW73090.1 Schizosaccharomyces specific protein [Schizosaccharomyces osmophilus]